MYADDLVILAPSVVGLSNLLSICEIFGESNDIIFNQKKSASLYFISKMLKGAHLPKQVDSILSRKFHMCSVPVKLKFFNSYCASLYTPHLWWNYKKMSVTKLHITST